MILKPDDYTRIATVARWYCLSAGHIMRHEQPRERWHPDHVDYAAPETRKRLHAMEYAVRRRLSALTNIVDSPPLGSAAILNQKAGWWVTPAGVRLVGAPWANVSPAHWQFAAHAWHAADVGMQIERLGYRVYSERELSTGKLVDGSEPGRPLSSTFVQPNGTSVEKKPDVAVMSNSSDAYIAIEVERDRNRPLGVYRDKLMAYRANPLVRAVWYVCPEESTARRVQQAAAAVYGDRWAQDPSVSLRIAQLVDRGGFGEIAHLDATPLLQQDLRELS